MRRNLTIFLFFFGLLSFAQQSEVSFIIKNFGVNVDGHFNQFVISIDQDSEGTVSGVSGKVEVNSIETGIETRDEHLLDEDYFNALRHPYITLESSSVVKLEKDYYKVAANLTIKGIIKPVSFKARLVNQETGTSFQSEFEINRRDFDVGGGGVLSKTVKIKVIYYLKS